MRTIENPRIAEVFASCPESVRLEFLLRRQLVLGTCQCPACERQRAA